MAAVALMAASGGYYAAMVVSTASQKQPSRLEAINTRALADGRIEDVVGQPRPAFTLADGEGVPVAVERYDGRLVLVNFWATWCAPCVEEMPMLSELQRQHDKSKFQIVGIAIDDPVKAADFARELGVEYPVLYGTADAVLVGRQYGNRDGLLPYSVLIDQQGTVRWAHLGALDPDELASQIAALL